MKKKILAIALVAIMAVVAVTGISLAYFTDTDSATNVFTAGNVKIDLTEADVVSDELGNLVADPDGSRHDVLDDEEDVYDYGKLYPAQSIYKDPTVEVLGSEDAYIAFKVTITDGAGDLHKVIGVEGYDNIDISPLVSGGLAGETVEQSTGYNGLPMVYMNENYAVYQVADKENGTYVLYFFVEAVQSKGDKVVLFDTITIPEKWDNAEMGQLVELSIRIDAYAVQSRGFDSCYEAMTSAFETEFAFN